MIKIVKTILQRLPTIATDIPVSKFLHLRGYSTTMRAFTKICIVDFLSVEIWHIYPPINDNLAELLQCVYQQQFGNTPEPISIGRLAEICDYSRDKVAVSTLTPSTYYSTENMLTEKAGAVDATSLPTVVQTTKCAVGDVLISNIRPYFKKIVYCQSECGCSTDVLCFHPKTPDLSAYLFCTVYASWLKRHKNASWR